MLFALLLVTPSSSAALFAALLAALRLVLLVGVLLGCSLALGTSLGRWLIVVLIIVISILVVIVLDDIKVVLESKGNELVLEFVGKFVVLVHEFSDILLGLSLLVIFLLLRGFTSGKLFFIGHFSGLEEIEETLLLNSLSNGLTWLTLLRLLLLFDLLLSHILAVFPVDLSSLALLDHVLIFCHDKRLLELVILEVVILLECKDHVVAVAGVMQDAFNIEQV